MKNTWEENDKQTQKKRIDVCAALLYERCREGGGTVCTRWQLQADKLCEGNCCLVMRNGHDAFKEVVPKEGGREAERKPSLAILATKRHNDKTRCFAVRSRHCIGAHGHWVWVLFAWGVSGCSGHVKGPYLYVIVCVWMICVFDFKMGLWRWHNAGAHKTEHSRQKTEDRDFRE